MNTRLLNSARAGANDINPGAGGTAVVRRFSLAITG